MRIVTFVSFLALLAPRLSTAEDLAALVDQRVRAEEGNIVSWRRDIHEGVRHIAESIAEANHARAEGRGHVEGGAEPRAALLR
ncbi:MAG TPA: hypothetical protein VFB20_02840 [Burkholderiales bacterium]|nr:hypothetical protein [Burkholderiales bacterium]